MMDKLTFVAKSRKYKEKYILIKTDGLQIFYTEGSNLFFEIEENEVYEVTIKKVKLK